MMKMIALAAGLLTLCSASAQAAGGDAWVAVWGASPTPPATVPIGPVPPTASYAGQTLRQVVRFSAGGRQVRLRISNEYGTRPLDIGAVHLALPAAGGAIQPGSDHVVTFGGAPGASIPPGAPLLSDPVDLPVSALSSLAVSIYLPTDTGPCTCHPTGAQTGYVSGPGDFTGASTFPVQSTFLSRAFLSGVEVKAAGDAGDRGAGRLHLRRRGLHPRQERTLARPAGRAPRRARRLGCGR